MDSGTLKPPRCRRQSRTTARLQGTQRKLMSLFQQMRPLKYRTTLESLRSKLSNRTSSTARGRWSMWEKTFLERPSKQESQDRPPFKSKMSNVEDSDEALIERWEKAREEESWKGGIIKYLRTTKRQQFEEERNWTNSSGWWCYDCKPWVSLFKRYLMWE